MKSIVVAAASILATLAVVGSFSLMHQGVDTLVSGECTSKNRVAAKKVYNTVALDIVAPRLRPFDASRATPETIAVQLGRIGALRAGAPEKVSDKCLLQEVNSWLNYYEREARGAIETRKRLDGYTSEYEKERVEAEDAKRALSQYLRAAPL